jgi:hypothetical protein
MRITPLGLNPRSGFSPRLLFRHDYQRGSCNCETTQRSFRRAPKTAWIDRVETLCIAT